MDTERKLEFRAAVTQSNKAIADLENQIDTFNRHIAVLNKYINGEKGPWGSKKNPFNERECLIELAKTQKYIADMKGLQMGERVKVDNLQRQMQHAEFVNGEQHMVIELQPTRKLEPIPGA